MFHLEEYLKKCYELKITELHVKKRGLPMGRLGDELILLDVPAKSLFESVIAALNLPEDWKMKTHETYYITHDELISSVSLYKSEGKWTIYLKLEKKEALSLSALSFPKPFFEKIIQAKSGLYFIIGAKNSEPKLTLNSLVSALLKEKAYHVANFFLPHESLKEGKGLIRTFLPEEVPRLSFLKALSFDLVLFDEEALKNDMSAILDLASEGHMVLVSLSASSIYEAILRFVPEEDLPLFAEVFSGASYQVKLGHAYAFETLINTPIVKERLASNKLKSLETLIPTGAKEGMQTLVFSLSELVKKGKVSEALALACAKDSRALMAYLKSEA